LFKTADKMDAGTEFVLKEASVFSAAIIYQKQFICCDGYVCSAAEKKELLFGVWVGQEFRQRIRFLMPLHQIYHFLQLPSRNPFLLTTSFICP